MKFAAAILLGLLAVSAAHGKSFNSWEKKAKELEAKFEKLVDHKAEVVIGKIKHAVTNIQAKSKGFIENLEREINATVAAALKEMEVLKLDVDVECFKNATRDIYAAEQAAVSNLLACKNLSQAYNDIQGIAQNATVLVNDVINDAKTIVAGVLECGQSWGIAKWKCVIRYVALEVKQLESQLPDAKAFIAVVKALGTDAELQVNTCLNDPTQQSLNKKVQEALAEFSTCAQQSTPRIE